MKLLTKINDFSKKLTPYKSLILLLLSWVLSRVMNGSYVATFVPFTLNLIACCMIIYDGIEILRTIVNVGHKLKTWVYWLSIILFGLMTLTISAGVVINLATVTTTINMYEGQESKSAQPDVIYVTYNPNCEFCEKSHKNMLRAVAAYSRTHSTHVQVVNLKNNTKLAKELDGRLDHYGSIVKFDKKGTLHETMYTTGNKEGEPVANTASDIYDRIGKVDKQ